MAFTRKMLKALSIEDEKIDSIMDAHAEVVDALKKQRDDYKADAEKLEGVQKELDGLKAGNGDSWQKKYEDEHKAFEDFKKSAEAERVAASKEKAARAFFESKGITGTNLEIAMRAARAEIDGAELDGDEIKDAKALEDLVQGTLAGLVVSTRTKGAQTANPPANNGGASLTREEIMKIKDTAERQKAIAEHLDLFKKG